MKRCKWVNMKNPTYIAYHDEEWGRPVHDDAVLYEFLLLECFQAGLSWEIVLNKREGFRKAFSNFDYLAISQYDEVDLERLVADPNIIRHRAKLAVAINNAKCFMDVQKEFGSFADYLWGFTDGKIIYHDGDIPTTTPLSDVISKDMKKRGFKFVGSTTIYSYLQAIGIVNDHEIDCDFRHTK